MNTKNVIWSINQTEDKKAVTSCHEAQLAVAMDIREELQNLNAILKCDNFLKIPLTLREICRRIGKKRKVKRRRNE